jgi:phosphoribosylformylglycinamidine cyclo-ligase
VVTYKEAGVDQTGADQFVGRIKKLSHVLDESRVIGEIGLFSGLMDISDLGYKEPVLAAGIDGVGSKLEVAFALGNHYTVGIDLVALSVNDVICCGARPLFFLDYMAVGRLDLGQGEAIVKGIVEGCRQAECALLGGETSQLPTFYRPGDVVVGLASSGAHSNGFTLIRRIVEEQGLEYAERFDADRTLGEELLTPMRIYVPEIMRLLEAGVDVRAVAHVTGGGIPGNLFRLLPNGVGARLEKGRWPVPKLFTKIAEWGGVSEEEMYAVFNMGLGMLVVVGRGEEKRALDALAEGMVVGECTSEEGVALV